MISFHHDFDEYNHYRTPLVHTYRKLTESKALTVVFFGGSVTNGYGIDDPDNFSWRGLTGHWLRAQFPSADITCINRAIGESGTYLGAHRVQTDVIAPAPDLIFLEYSINDYYYGSTYEKAASQVETILREIRTALPHTDVVILLVTDVSCLPLNKEGKLHPQAQAHEDIARAYDIPTLHVGRYLAKTVQYEAENFRPAYARDIVHLTEAGNAVYFACVEEFLHNSLLAADLSADADLPHSLPPMVSRTLFDGDRRQIQPSEEVLAASEALGGKGVLRQPEGYSPNSSSRGVFTLSSPDAMLAVKFSGTEIALWCNYYKDDRFRVSIDGGDFMERPGSSHSPAILAENLPSGEHIIRIQIVSGDKPLVIGSLFTRDATKATSFF